MGWPWPRLVSGSSLYDAIRALGLTRYTLEESLGAPDAEARRMVMFAEGQTNKVVKPHYLAKLGCS